MYVCVCVLLLFFFFFLPPWLLSAVGQEKEAVTEEVAVVTTGVVAEEVYMVGVLGGLALPRGGCLSVSQPSSSAEVLLV